MNFRLNRLKATLLILSVTSLIFLSCAGGRGLRIEIDSGKDNSSQLRELAESQAAGRSAIEELPEPTADEYERMGDALIGKQNYYLAYVHYAKSLKQHPGNKRLEYKQGLSLLLAGKNDEAIAQFDAVLTRDQEFSLAHEGIGRAYLQKRQYAKAKNYFQKALSLNDGLWRSHNFLGIIYDFEKLHQLAILEYMEAVRVNPDNGSLYNNLGVSYSMAGKPEAAVEAFEMAIDRNFREDRIYNNLGLALGNLQKYDQAFEAFKKGGGEAQAYNNLGVIYLGRGQYSDAVECFERAIELEPSFYTKAGENLKRARMLHNRQ